jgi:hypothetical protein
VNHLALEILIAILAQNEEGRAREGLCRLPTAPPASLAGGIDENETALPEAHKESGGKKYRVFIVDIAERYAK